MKQMMKKAVAFLLAMMLMISMVPVDIALATGDSTPTIAFGNVSVDLAEVDYIYVPVTISNNPGVAGITWEISIPDDMVIDSFEHLDYDEENGSIFTELNKKGKLVMSDDVIENHNTSKGLFILGSSEVRSTDGILFWVVYELSEDIVNGTYEVGVTKSNKMCDENTAVDITDQFTFVGGTITVTGGVEVAPVIKTQPADVTYTYGDTGNALSVELDETAFTAGTLTYQWYQNDVAVDGANGATLNVDGLGAGTYNYHCVVTNTYEGKDYTTKSSVATVSVNRASVAVPEAVTGLVYDGNAKTGIPSSNLYTVENGTASDAGTYTATLALVDAANSAWADGSTGEKTVEWSIAKAAVSPVPTAVENLIYNGKSQVGVNFDSASGYNHNTGVIEAINAGDYAATFVVDGNHAWTGSEETGYVVNWSIAPYNVAGEAVTDTTNKTQNVVVNVGTFVAPTVVGFEGEAVTGTVAYSYDGETDKATIEAKLAALAKGTTATISYTFTANGNYTGTISGEIAVTMVDILFYVGEDIAVAGNTLTVKDAPVYGDTWADIVTLTGEIKASLDGVEVPGTYKLDVTATDAPNAGTYTVKVLFTADEGDKYVDVTVLTHTITVARIAVTEEPSVVTGLEYTGNEQTGVNYAKEKGYNVQGVLSATDAGDYTATASVDGNHTWKDGTTADKTLSWSIAKAAIDVSGVKWAYDGPYTYVPVTGSYVVDLDATTIPAGVEFTLSGNSGSDAGTYVATAVAKLADGYSADNYVIKGEVESLTWVINPAEVDVSELKWNYTSESSFSYDVWNGEARSVELVDVPTYMTVAYVGNSYVNAGSYTATATLTSNDKNYVLKDADAEGKVTLTLDWVIKKFVNTCPVTVAGLVYNGTEQTGVERFHLDLVSLAEGSDHYAQTDAGNYKTKFVLKDTDNMEWSMADYDGVERWGIAAYDVSGDAVTDTTGKTQNVVVGVGSFAGVTVTGFNGEAVTGTVAYSYDGETDKAAIETKLAALTKGDTATIGYTFTANGNYTGTISGEIAVTMVDILFYVGDEIATVENAVTIKADATYGDTMAEIIQIGDIKASVNGEPVVGTYTLNSTGIPGAGTHEYKVLFNSSNGKYEDVVVVSGTVTVAKKPVAVEWGNTSLEYNGQEQAPVASATGLNNEVIALTVTGQGKNAGTTYVATATTENPNYELTNASTEFSIAQKMVSVQWGENREFAYNGQEQAPIAAVPTGIEGETLTVTVVGATNAGEDLVATASISDSDTALAANYLLANSSAVFTIVPKSIEVVWSGTELTYNGSAQVPTAVASGVVDGDTVEVVVSGEQTNVGTGYEASAATANTNYTISNATQSFVIKAKEIAVAVADIETVTYTGSELKPTVTVSSENTVSGYQLVEGTDYTVQYENNTNAGTAIVTVSPVEGSNYTFTAATKNFTINKADVNASADDFEKVYDGKAVAASDIKTSATLNGKAVAGTWAIVSEAEMKNVGDYEATLQFTPADDANYNVPEAKNIMVVITKATPAGEPGYTLINAGGKTLADAKLNVGTLVPAAGSIKWVDENGEELALDTAVEANVTYNWVFTPDDANYTSKSGGVVLYTYVPVVIPSTPSKPVESEVVVEEPENGSVSTDVEEAEEGDTVTITITPDEGWMLDELVIVTADGTVIEVVEVSEGVYTFVMPEGEVSISAVFVEAASEMNFVDVTENDWFYSNVEYVFRNGLMNGVSDTEFNPYGDTSRAMIVTVLWRLEGKPVVNYLMQFEDVEADTWYTEAVRWAASVGIVTGYSETAFGPTDNITREQLVTILYRYAQIKGYDVSVGEDTNILSYEDALTVSEYAIPAMQWACGSGLVQGDGVNLTPKAEAIRAQVAAIFQRFCEKVAI